MAGPFDLTDVARRAITFRDARDWRQFHTPKNLMSGLSIEAAELVETLLWSNPSSDELRADAATMEEIRKELADVLIYALTLAHDLDINLAQAVDAKLEANGRRYSVEEYRGSSSKAPHTEQSESAR